MIVPPALTGESRKASRVPGKSDPVDATAVALAAIREGLDRLPVAFLDERSREIRVLCDYRDQLMGERARLINRLRWHLVRIAPELEAQLGPAALKRPRIRARAIHIIALGRTKLDPATRLYLTRKQTEDKPKLEAIRCLKRHIARQIWHLLDNSQRDSQPPPPSRPTRIAVTAAPGIMPRAR